MGIIIPEVKEAPLVSHCAVTVDTPKACMIEGNIMEVEVIVMEDIIVPAINVIKRHVLCDFVIVVHFLYLLL